MEKLLTNLLIASATLLIAKGQGIQDKLWVVNIEQGDNILLADGGTALLHLNSYNAHYLIAPADDSILPSTGGYAIKETSEAITLSLRRNWNLNEETIYEISMNSVHEGRFELKSADPNHFQSGKLELIENHENESVSPGQFKKEYLLTIPAALGNPKSAIKMVWESSGGRLSGCFNVLKFDNFTNGIEFFADGTTAFSNKDEYWGFVFNGEEMGGWNLSLTFVSKNAGWYQCHTEGSLFTKHKGIFFYVPDPADLPFFNEVSTHFQTTNCEQPLPEWNPENDGIVGLSAGKKTHPTNPVSISIRYAYTRGIDYLFQSSKDLESWETVQEFTGLSITGNSGVRSLVTEISSNPFFLRVIPTP